MAITPEVNNEILTDSAYEIGIYPSKTYKMFMDKCRIIGNVDGIDAMPQAIYKILYTERSTFGAYSDNYGIELIDLIGMQTTYVIPELERRIKEALEWDSRIDLVNGFEFEVNGSHVTALFTVHTIFGDIETERTVEI
jgi:hypothetical protein